MNPIRPLILIIFSLILAVEGEEPKPVSAWLLIRENSITNKLASLQLGLNLAQLKEACKEERALNPLIPADDGPVTLVYILKVKLKVLRELQAASNKSYDFEKNRPSIHPILDFSLHQRSTQILVTGMSPQSIKDPEIRAEYEKAVAEHERRVFRDTLEATLKQEIGMTIDDVRRFVGMYFRDPAARQQALAVIESEIADQALREKTLAAIPKIH